MNNVEVPVELFEYLIEIATFEPSTPSRQGWTWDARTQEKIRQAIAIRDAAKQASASFAASMVKLNEPAPEERRCKTCQEWATGCAGCHAPEYENWKRKDAS